jgi:hypothetical protein
MAAFQRDVQLFESLQDGIDPGICRLDGGNNDDRELVAGGQTHGKWGWRRVQGQQATGGSRFQPGLYSFQVLEPALRAVIVLDGFDLEPAQVMREVPQEFVIG